MLLELVWADSGYNAHQVDTAVAKVPSSRIEVVKRSDDMKGFVLLPRRWVVRENLLMVRPQPPPRQGLGKPRNDASRFRPSRLDPDRHQKTRAVVAFESGSKRKCCQYVVDRIFSVLRRVSSFQ
jgi:transposase